MRALFSLALLLLSQPSNALDVLAYEAAGFARAQQEGRLVAIQFHSGWCPVCVMQERGVRALHGERAWDKTLVYQADFFKEEALRKQLGVTSFSTLVVFRGTQERARTTGDFRPEQLRPLFAKAL